MLTAVETHPYDPESVLPTEAVVLFADRQDWLKLVETAFRVVGEAEDCPLRLQRARIGYHKIKWMDDSADLNPDGWELLETERYGRGRYERIPYDLDLRWDSSVRVWRTGDEVVLDLVGTVNGVDLGYTPQISIAELADLADLPAAWR